MSNNTDRIKRKEANITGVDRANLQTQNSARLMRVRLKNAKSKEAMRGEWRNTWTVTNIQHYSNIGNTCIKISFAMAGRMPAVAETI